MFRIGQKVMCADDAPRGDPRLAPNGYWVPNWPTRGCIYTVRGLGHKGSIVLEEIVNPIRSFAEGFYEAHRLSSRFRPIVERKTETGMAILREILDREKKPVLAR